jgi:Mce-associated membrane protein
MPPPRRRRPVQPATRVRIPRTARPRGTSAGDAPGGGRLPVAEAPGSDLAQDDQAQDDHIQADPAGDGPARDGPDRDEPARDEPPGEELARDEPPGDEPAGDEPVPDKPAGHGLTRAGPVTEKLAHDGPAAGGGIGDETAVEGQAAAGEKADGGAPRHPLALPAGLGVLAVILGGLAVWFGLEASNATSGVDASNTALTDPATTRQVTQQVTSAVDKIFSYNYADTAKTSQAAAGLLAGQARQQYATLFKLVRRDAPKEKLVLTTTVTDSGVEFLDGSQARLLIFADQRDRAGALHKTTMAGAMFAVNAVNQGGRWKITNIDTFGPGG